MICRSCASFSCGAWLPWNDLLPCEINLFCIMGWLHANFAFAESLIGLLNSLSAVDCIRAMIDVFDQTYYNVSVEKCKISPNSVVGSIGPCRVKKRFLLT